MILLLAEHNNLKLNIVTKHILTAAKSLKQDIHVLVIGYNCKNVIEEIQKLQGVNLVLIANHKIYEHPLAENIALIIKKISDEYKYIIAPSTTFGKDILPRVAALLGIEQISDIIKIIDPNNFIRPIYAGNALATVTTSPNIKKIITVRPASFAIANMGFHKANTRNLNIVYEAKNTKFIKFINTHNNTLPNLNSSRIIVAGGRGFASKDNFLLLQQLAKTLQAAIGATRAAVDAGFVENDLQIGQTGKIVAPDLYIAIGISGAIQHIAGIKDSKTIVAINCDPDAPIFDIADYGLVMDLFKAIPKLIAILSNYYK